MKRLTAYFFEESYGAENPVPGDCFDIEVDTDTVIETVVTELTDDGDVIISLDEAAMSMLQQQGVLFESSNMPSAVDSTSAIHGGPRQKVEPTDGFMSPISGNAFLPYDRKKDPREWFTDIKKKLKESEEYCDACDRVVSKCVCDDHKHEVKEAEYQGRKVPLGKPMAGDVKKSKVYVRKPNGNIVKVNFGDKTMKIKKSNPKRRKSFRARHNCANPGPRWKARYWSCRAW
jgi:hypothetical protein